MASCRRIHGRACCKEIRQTRDTAAELLLLFSTRVPKNSTLVRECAARGTHRIRIQVMLRHPLPGFLTDPAQSTTERREVLTGAALDASAGTPEPEMRQFDGIPF